MPSTLKTAVAIIGAGVMGLWLTRKLSKLAVPVTLIESNNRLAASSSTRNEGWLHAGSYHAAAIEDRGIALQVARRTREGYHQTLRFAPEALGQDETRTFVLVDEERLNDVVGRWDEAGVNYRRLARRVLTSLEPRLRVDKFAGLFEVDDRPINTPVLYKRLIDDACAHGARILTGTRVTDLRGTTLTFEQETGASGTLDAKVIVFAAGFSTKSVVRDLLGLELPFRFWRSHLIDLPRFSNHAFFGIRPGEATCMPHGLWSIAGLNADQEELAAPSFEPLEANVRRATEALQCLVRDIDLSHLHPRACVKVDMDPGRAAIVDRLGFAPPQLNISYGEIAADVFWVLPGKMTEAPFAADVLIRRICDATLLSPQAVAAVAAATTALENPQPQPALRPIDEYEGGLQCRQ